MPLVRFTWSDDVDHQIADPPADALERASWLHMALCRMLHSVLTDESITDKERRAEAGVLATKITQATPNHEIHQARRKIADDEKKTEKKAALDGKVEPSATQRQSSHLRADAPRGRAKKED